MLGLSWPEIHGALTHFPVALLLTAAVFELGAALFHKPAGRQVSFWLLAAAVVMAVPTLLTGWITGSELFTAAGQPPGTFIWHRSLAFITSGLAIVLLAWRILSHDQLSGLPLVGSILLLLVIGGTVGCTGYLGGRMVFSGVGQGRADEHSREHSHGDDAGPAESRSPAGRDAARASAAVTAQEVLAGKALFERQSCTGCHRMNGVGGSLGPDLSKEGSHHPDPEWQIAHLKDPEKMSPGSTMPHFDKLSPDELKALAAFLITRK